MTSTHHTIANMEELDLVVIGAGTFAEPMALVGMGVPFDA
jgi:hypothetical protein